MIQPFNWTGGQQIAVWLVCVYEVHRWSDLPLASFLYTTKDSLFGTSQDPCLERQQSQGNTGQSTGGGWNHLGNEQGWVMPTMP